MFLFFRVKYIPFLTVTSQIDDEAKVKLKVIMNAIGGKVIDYFDENCTHLTTSVARATNKVCHNSIC